MRAARHRDRRRLVRQINEIDQLVAWVVPEQTLDAAGNPEPPPAASLRDALKARLPSYMVPARFEFVGSVPRLLKARSTARRSRLLNWPRCTARSNPTSRRTRQKSCCSMRSEHVPGEAIERDAVPGDPGQPFLCLLRAWYRS